MNSAFIIQAARAIDTALRDNEADIEALDRAIGDGDHYINMTRGATAVTALAPELDGLPVGQALHKIGLKLLSTIGGASGPLLASFFMAFGKALDGAGVLSPLILAEGFSAGVDAIRLRGKADVGEKTMLDVLIPVAARFRERTGENADIPSLTTEIKALAEERMRATRDLRASKGRAAFLGERAIGHIDPGAKSCQVMIAAVCDLALTTAPAS